MSAYLVHVVYDQCAIPQPVQQTLSVAAPKQLSHVGVHLKAVDLHAHTIHVVQELAC